MNFYPEESPSIEEVKEYFKDEVYEFVQRYQITTGSMVTNAPDDTKQGMDVINTLVQEMVSKLDDEMPSKVSNFNK